MGSWLMLLQCLYIYIFVKSFGILDEILSLCFRQNKQWFLDKICFLTFLEIVLNSFLSNTARCTHVLMYIIQWQLVCRYCRTDFQLKLSITYNRVSLSLIYFNSFFIVLHYKTLNLNISIYHLIHPNLQKSSYGTVSITDPATLCVSLFCALPHLPSQHAEHQEGGVSDNCDFDNAWYFG